ncbi:YcaO-like family protein [Micromonospora sp. NPDC047074]|uniref:YcaO-like family protein n=1 Tax=Micromonospora sp. NPDC047074 TaxID=3154339 RepID=UPI0033DA400C
MTIETAPPTPPLGGAAAHLHRMTSSLREVPLETTLSRAEALAGKLGITRVTDTTWLDCIGIPIFASIRPGATPGSLCVNAGKGVREAEARVGAYMEAIEFAYAEYGRRNIDVVATTPRAVAAQPDAGFEFVDLCPVLQVPVELDGPIDCVEAEDMISGNRILVPAELVFSPFLENRGQQIFGTSTNGLCSGNSIREATLHGLCEVIERDVQSFNYFRDSSRWVVVDDDLSDLADLLRRTEGAGLQGAVRYTASRYGLPYFQGFIMEPSDDAPIAISSGNGLHIVRDIAAVRGLSEAAQSRLSYIHGGRDDLTSRFEYFSGQDRRAERQATASLRARVLDRTDALPYSSIPDRSGEVSSIDGAIELLVDALRREGVGQVLRVLLSEPAADLAVVRVIVPKLEFFQPTLKRVGPRLARFVGASR